MRIIKLVFLILILSTIISGCASVEEEGANIATNVSIKETKELIKDKEDLVILDVRTKEEYEAGHIEGAVQIPLNELNYRIDELEEYKDKPLLVYCRSGNRSSKALLILEYNYFNEIYHMNQGFMNWK